MDFSSASSTASIALPYAEELKAVIETQSRDHLIVGMRQAFPGSRAGAIFKAAGPEGGLLDH
jgi:hypothetical protein